MFKHTISDTKRFWRYIFLLQMSGFVLFLLGATFYGSFKELAVALNAKETVLFTAWLKSGALALLVGSFWLAVYILFEAAKKGIIDLIYKTRKDL